MKKTTLTLCGLSLMAVINGCSTDTKPRPVLHPLPANHTVPDRYASAKCTNVQQTKHAWLRSFHDKTLEHIVYETLRHNPDLHIAAERVAQSEAILRLGLSESIPKLNLQGNYTQRSWEAQGKHGRGNIVLALNWEPDIWGKISDANARDKAALVSNVFYYEWARQSLAATAAKLWYTVSADKMTYRFASDIVALQKEAQRILRKRAEIGSGNERDVHMINAMLAEARDLKISLLSRKERDTRALETLMGRYPANKLKARNLPAVPKAIPHGVPLDLLNNRPDVIAAQLEVAAAFHNRDAVSKLRLPSITLGAQAGVDVLQDTMAKLIGGLFMPIFDAGAIQAKIDAATAEQRAAIARYQKTVLEAYKEVENALALERQLAARYRYISAMVREYKQAYEMTKANYDIGQGSYIDVLTVQSKWIDARIRQLDIHKQRLVNRINLHLALGESFERIACRVIPEKAR